MAGRRRNPEPAPLMLPQDEKPIGRCNHCRYFAVVWDEIGVLKMQKHYMDRHPEKI